MSQYTQEITELKTNESHWCYARGKAAQLKLAFKNKKAELEREKQIQIQEERERNYQSSDQLVRYEALEAAAHFSNMGWL
ncbi:hypothetical protein [Pseudoalteromonas sp. GW168-MNA-CIBAN-0100]|uniref:hypothetical protein n=1 Tax=Pseudoalteromonas sp. GW168-MNA-CIBAN-0100 TaxID=3140434 RepID=UPI0033294761